MVRGDALKVVIERFSGRFKVLYSRNAEGDSRLVASLLGGLFKAGFCCCLLEFVSPVSLVTKLSAN